MPSHLITLYIILFFDAVISMAVSDIMWGNPMFDVKRNSTCFNPTSHGRFYTADIGSGYQKLTPCRTEPPVPPIKNRYPDENTPLSLFNNRFGQGRSQKY